MDVYSSYPSSSYDGFEEGSVPVWFFVVVNVILSLVTIIGSVMVILAYVRDAKIRKTVAFTIILNLSVTDLLVGIFIFPLNTAWWVEDEWIFGMIPCKLWLVLDYSLFSVSTFTIVFISLDRYWLLTKGLSYQKFQTMKQVIVVLAMIWVVAILVYTGIVVVVPRLSSFDREFDPTDCELQVVQTSWFNIFEIVVNFIIPFASLVFLNYKVFTNIRERSKGLITCKNESSDIDTDKCTESSKTNVDAEYENNALEMSQKDGLSIDSINIKSLEGEQPPEKTAEGKDSSMDAPSVIGPPQVKKEIDTNVDGKTEQVPQNVDVETKTKKEAPVESRIRKRRRGEKNDFRRYRKAAITLAALVIVYCLCCVPYFIYAIVVSFCKTCVSLRVWEFVSYLQWANSCMNPFIYGLTNTLFRRNFVKFLCLQKWVKE